MSCDLGQALWKDLNQELFQHCFDGLARIELASLQQIPLAIKSSLGGNSKPKDLPLRKGMPARTSRSNLPYHSLHSRKFNFSRQASK